MTAEKAIRTGSDSISWYSVASDTIDDVRLQFYAGCAGPKSISFFMHRKKLRYGFDSTESNPCFRREGARSWKPGPDSEPSRRALAARHLHMIMSFIIRMGWTLMNRGYASVPCEELPGDQRKQLVICRLMGSFPVWEADRSGLHLEIECRMSPGVCHCAQFLKPYRERWNRPPWL